jgi:ribosome-binding protein aMBF1 (putative translation factor)
MVMCTLTTLGTIVPILTRENWNYRSCHYSLVGWQSGRMRCEELARSFGIVLKKHRKLKKISQELLAEKADVAPKMISLIERFERNPTLNLADSLAQGLGIPLWELLKEADELRKKERPAKK